MSSVLQVIDKLDIGGAERVMIDLTNILYENGVEVSVLFLLDKNQFSEELKNEIFIYELKRRFKFSVIKMFQCFKTIQNYNIIHCHNRYVFNYIKLVTLIFPVKSKVILHDHFGTIDIDRRVPFLYHSIFKPKYYIGVSKSLINWAKTELNLNPNFIFSLPNIIRKSDDSNLKSENYLYDFVVVGNIKQVKNQQFVLELSERLKTKTLIIGNNQDADYYESLNKYQNFEILQGISRPISMIKNSRLALHAAISESGPLVLLEYLSIGKPFLAYKTGMVADQLFQEFPIMFIDNFKIEDWKKRIEQIESSYSQLSQKMIDCFNDKYSEEKYLKRCLEIYKKVEKSY